MRWINSSAQAVLRLAMRSRFETTSKKLAAMNLPAKR